MKPDSSGNFSEAAVSLIANLGIGWYAKWRFRKLYAAVLKARSGEDLSRRDVGAIFDGVSWTVFAVAHSAQGGWRSSRELAEKFEALSRKIPTPSGEEPPGSTEDEEANPFEGVIANAVRAAQTEARQAAAARRRPPRADEERPAKPPAEPGQ